MILIIALSPSLDVTYEVDVLRAGDITRPWRVTRVAGGKALNVARVARTLGAGVRVVAALGGHTGLAIAERLAAEQVELVTVPLRRDTRTSIAIVEDGEGTSSTDLYEPATQVDIDEWAAFRDAVLAQCDSEIRWVAISGSLPAGVSGAALRALLSELRMRGARIAVDSSGAGLRALIDAADLIKVNRSEAAELVGIDVPTSTDAARTLHDRWGIDAVVTDGIRGAAALLGGSLHEVPVPERRGRFSAGSGDAFLGGLLAALDDGATARDALALARRSAERNAQVAGQGILEPLERGPET